MKSIEKGRIPYNLFFMSFISLAFNIHWSPWREDKSLLDSVKITVKRKIYTADDVKEVVQAAKRTKL